MAQDISIVTEAAMRGVVPLNHELLDVIERGFSAVAQGRVTWPEAVSAVRREANRPVDVNTANIGGAARIGGGVGKGNSGFLDSPKTEQASLNRYLDDLCSAAAGAVAAKYLAPKDVRVAGVIGTGVQARLQMRAAHLVRPFERLLVFGRNIQKAARCAVDLSDALGIDCEVTTDPADLVAQSQLVVTATSARAPVIKAEWLHKGLHITAMGADRTGKTEIDPRALVAASLYVTDRASQCAVLGELEAALAAGLWPVDRPLVELGDVIFGKVEGRQDAADITICDLTGAGYRTLR